MASRPPRSRAGVFDHSDSGPNRSATRSACTYIPRSDSARIGASSAEGISIGVQNEIQRSVPRPLLFPRSAGRVGERAENVQHVAQLGQPHSVPVQEFTEGKLVVDSLGILFREPSGHVVQQAQEGTFDQRERLLATVPDARKFVGPSSEKRLPAGRGVLCLMRGPQVSQLLALHLNQFSKQGG